MRERNIWIVRHGEKRSYNGDLSRQGRKKARQFGRTLDSQAPVFIYTSSAPRVRHTVEEFVAGASIERVKGIEEREDLSIPSFLKDRLHSEYFRRSRTSAESAYRTPRVFGKRRRAVEKSERRNLQDWLEWDRDITLLRDSAYTAYPPELARAMAPFLLQQITGMLPKLQNHEGSTIVNFAHEYNAAAIIAEFFYALDSSGNRVSGYEILRKRNYRIPPLGGARIRVYDGPQKELYLFGQLDNDIYNVDIDKLRMYAHQQQTMSPVATQKALA